MSAFFFCFIHFADVWSGQNTFCTSEMSHIPVSLSRTVTETTVDTPSNDNKINITPSKHQHPAVSVHWRHLTLSAAVAHYSCSYRAATMSDSYWVNTAPVGQLQRPWACSSSIYILFWSLLGGVFCGLLSQVSVNVLTQHRLHSLKIRTVSALVDAKNTFAAISCCVTDHLSWYPE